MVVGCRRGEKSKTISKVARRVAKWISRSLNAYLTSADEEVEIGHIFWKAQEPIKELGGRRISRADLVKLVRELWHDMQDQNCQEVKLSHDGYFKLWSLRQADLTQPQSLCECGPGNVVCMQGSRSWSKIYYRCCICQTTGKQGYSHIMIDEA